MSAFADEKIKVSNHNMSFTESWNKSSSWFNNGNGGSISWNASTRTLTLDNFDLDRQNDLAAGSFLTCIEVNSTKSITIVLKGNSYLGVGRGQTLVLHGNTTFKGDGYLGFWNRDTQKPCIEMAEENLTLTIDGPTLSMQSRGIRRKNNTGTFYMKSGTLKGPSGAKVLIDMGYVQYAYGMGVQQPHGFAFSSAKHCMVDADGNPTNKRIIFGSIKYYGFRINGIHITESNYETIHKLNAVKSGSIIYTPSSNTLTLIDATILNNTDAPTISNDSNDGFIISLRGRNKFTFDTTREPQALYLKENTTITNTFSSTASLEAAPEYTGINVANGKKLMVFNVKLDVPYLAGGGASSELSLSNDVEIIARGNGSKGTVRQLRITDANAFGSGIAVKSNKDNPRFIRNSTTSYGLSGVYKDISYLATGEVVLSTKSNREWYPLYICGYKVNSLNKDNPVSEYVTSGKLSFNSTQNALTMDNAHIDYPGESEDDPVIKWTSANAFRVSIVGAGNTIDSREAEAIHSNANTEITAPTDGYVLTVTGDNGCITVRGLLTFSVGAVFTVPQIETDKLVVKNCALDVKRWMTTSTCELEYVKVASTPEAPAYYDNVKKNVVAGKGPVCLLPSNAVSVYPGITFCGEEVNSANHTYLMNKYVSYSPLKDNGSLSVTKTSEGYDISMEDFQLDEYESSVPVFNFTSKRCVDFFVRGKNTFGLSRGNALFLDGDTKEVYIIARGDSAKLNITGNSDAGGNSGAIAVDAGSSLHIMKPSHYKDFHIWVQRIYGKGTSSKLVVHDPYLSVLGHPQGTVSNISCELPYDGTAELYCTWSRPCEIRSDGVYQNGSLCTGEVFFVAEGESYIPVRSVSLEPIALTLTKKGETAQLTASVRPNDATNQTVFWVSANESVATVDAKGKVTAVGKGSTDIYVYSVDMEDSDASYSPGSSVRKSLIHSSNHCSVTVDIPEPTGITLSETDVLIDREGIGGIYLTANLTPSNADTEYTWTSSDDNIVTVKENSGQTALVRRIADEGTATITVTTANGLSASCNVTIHYPVTPEYVEFDPRTYTLTEVGQQIKLTPIVTPANCEKLSFTWNTYGEAISLSDDGTVTALRSGSAVVECWACYDGQKWAPGEARIYVELPVIATDLKITPNSIETFYSLGESVWLKPVFTPENVTNDSVVWATTDASVATVDEHGLVTVVGWGDCDITATTTDGSKITARCWIQAIDPSTIVEPVPGTDIKLDVNEVSMLIGDEATIGLTIAPADYNGDIMVESMSDGEYWNVVQANIDYDWNLNKSFLRIRSEEMGQEGDVQFRVRLTYADMEALNAQGIWTEPSDTITIHVRSGVFSALSPEDISVTYHVSDFNDKACSVYAMSDPMNLSMDPELDDYIVTPAIAPTTIGKLTVPSRADGYWVTSVSNSAFQTCSSLTEIEFSEGITSIGEKVCYSRLFGLERVTLPSTIEELGTYCFAANWRDYTSRSNLREVNIKASTPPTGQNGSSIEYTSAFYNIAEDAVLYVPTGALAAYNVYPWTYWFSRIEEKAFFEDQDAIASPKSSPEGKDFNWFDLSGRRISKPAKSGLYIQNGRKFVIR